MRDPQKVYRNGRTVGYTEYDATLGGYVCLDTSGNGPPTWATSREGAEAQLIVFLRSTGQLRQGRR